PRPPTSTLFPYTTLFRSRLQNIPNPCATGKTAVTLRFENLYRHTYYAASKQTARSSRTCPTRRKSKPFANSLPNKSRSISGLSRSEEHTSELQSRENLVC